MKETKGVGVLTVIAVVEACLMGCMIPDVHHTDPYQGGPPPGESPPTAASAAQPAPQGPPVSSKEGLRHRAEDALRKAGEVRQQAKAAIDSDGTPEAQAIYNEVAGCPNARDACLDHAKALEARSRTGARAGVAAYLTKPLGALIFSRSYGVMVGDADVPTILKLEPDIALADTAANEAGQAAQQAVDARAERQRKIDEEGPAVGAAADACAKDESACKAKCDKGDGAYCVAWAARLRNAKPPKLEDARTYFQKACDAGVQHGCMSIPNLLQQMADAQAKVERLWTDVTVTADELTLRTFRTQNAAKTGTRPKVLQEWAVVTRAVVDEKYCPARAAFVRGASLADFQARATKHCRDEAPVDQGISGANITLTSWCTQAFATPCP